jgi:iron complex outermembrane receptor protein
VAPLGAQQPTGMIRGRVTDGATQQPLSAATVTVAGRSARTTVDGRYLIPGLAAGSYTLNARLIGYASASQPVTVGGGDTVVVDLAMARQAVGLSEVVVTGYGQQLAGNVTGAQSQVNAQDFNTGTNASPQQLIANKVAGLQIVDNNEPGGGLAVRIRGQASVNAGSEPLYVLDGVPLGTGSGGGLSAGRDPLNFLNPNDIGSITVLKDAAAAAIYGANASNGVVLITTKSGRGRTRVEYNGSVSGAWVTQLPSMLNAAQFRAAVLAHAPPRTDTLLLNANTDWFSLVDRTAMGQTHDVALSGVGTTNSYRLSLGYASQDGILQGTTAQRISLGVNYNQQLYSGRLDLHAYLRGSRTLDQYTPNGVLYNAAQMGPTQPVYDPASATGYYNWPGNLLTSADNPAEVLNTSKDHGTTYRSIGNIQAKYDFSAFRPLEGLTGTLNLGYDVTDVNRVTFYPNNIHLQTKNGNLGSFYRNTPSQLNTVLEGYLDYRPPASLGPGNFDLTAGYSYSQSHAEYASISASQLGNNLLADNGLPPAGSTLPVDTIGESKLISFFGRAEYNIGDRYLRQHPARRVVALRTE